MISPPRYSIGSTSSKGRKPTMPRKTGLMMRRSCFSGPSPNTAEARALPLKSWTKTTGSRLRISFPAVTIRSASTSSIKTRNRRSRRVTGLSEKMRSSSDSSERMAPSSGVRLPISWMRISMFPEMENNAESAGLTSWTRRSKRTHSV